MARSFVTHLVQLLGNSKFYTMLEEKIEDEANDRSVPLVMNEGTFIAPLKAKWSPAFRFLTGLGHPSSGRPPVVSVSS